jgi:hypothetical protein
MPYAKINVYPHKFNTFQYQNEYRIAIKDYSDIPYDLNICSIKDISVLLNKFKVENLVIIALFILIDIIYF